MTISWTHAAPGILAVLFAVSWASAQEVYVDSELGSEQNDGSSPDSPKQTLESVSGFGARYQALYLKAGGTYPTSGLSVSNATLTRYGDGQAPVVVATGEGFGIVTASGGAVVDGIKVMGANADVGGTGISVSGNDNEVRNCEIDGSGSGMMMGFGVMGTGNYIHHNNVHDLGVSISGSEMGNSGGAEAYMILSSDNEIAYNIAYNCWSNNSTLGGAEGGCLEIVNREAGSTVSNVHFHHNYCERSVGLFEGCSGDFSGQDQIQLHHGIIRDSSVAYNVCVDAMWLYLLQPVNTDFVNLVFEHNTLVHTPANADIPQQGASAFTLAVEQETVGGTTYGPTPVQPGNITVRNNVFLVNGGSGMFNGTLPDGDHYNNLYAGVAFPNNWTQHPTEIVVGAAEAGVGDDGRLAAGSVAIDTGATEVLVASWTDFDGNAVPQGAAPDIGAFEYCEGDSCQEPTELGTGGTGGASGTATGGTGGEVVATCVDGLTLCGDICVELTSDASHCGGCDVACPDGQVCSAGSCTGACDAGLDQCGQDCVDLATNLLNCGSCDAACSEGQGCTNGVCTGTPTGGDPTEPNVEGADAEATDDDAGCGCVAAGAGRAGRAGAPLALLLALGAIGRSRRRHVERLSRLRLPRNIPS